MGLYISRCLPSGHDDALEHELAARRHPADLAAAEEDAGHRGAPVADGHLERVGARAGHNPDRSHLAGNPGRMPRHDLVDRRGVQPVAEGVEFLAIQLFDRFRQLLDEFAQRHDSPSHQSGPRITLRDLALWSADAFPFRAVDRGCRAAVHVGARRLFERRRRPNPTSPRRRRPRRRRRRPSCSPAATRSCRPRVPTPRSTKRRSRPCSTRARSTSTPRCSRH